MDPTPRVLLLGRLGCFVALAASCGGVHHPSTGKTSGSIAGLARDHDSGDPVSAADVRIRAQGQLGAATTTRSNAQGLYAIDHLAPGRYDLTAQFAGQPVDVGNVVVRANQVAVVDLVFTLGRPDAIHADFGSPQSAIDRYHPRSLAAEVGRLEGTIGDLGSKERIAGAVVNAVGGPSATTLQAVTDDQGRYRFEVAPGTYVVSAYYSIDGHGQIEVRRSDIAVAGGEAVVVPLWIESTR